MVSRQCYFRGTVDVPISKEFEGYVPKVANWRFSVGNAQPIVSGTKYYVNDPRLIQGGGVDVFSWFDGKVNVDENTFGDEIAYSEIQQPLWVDGFARGVSAGNSLSGAPWNFICEQYELSFPLGTGGVHRDLVKLPFYASGAVGTAGAVYQGIFAYPPCPVHTENQAYRPALLNATPDDTPPQLSLQVPLGPSATEINQTGYTLSIAGITLQNCDRSSDNAITFQWKNSVFSIPIHRIGLAGIGGGAAIPTETIQLEPATNADVVAIQTEVFDQITLNDFTNARLTAYGRLAYLHAGLKPPDRPALLAPLLILVSLDWREWWLINLVPQDADATTAWTTGNAFKSACISKDGILWFQSGGTAAVEDKIFIGRWALPVVDNPVTIAPDHVYILPEYIEPSPYDWINASGV